MSLLDGADAGPIRVYNYRTRPVDVSRSL